MAGKGPHQLGFTAHQTGDTSLAWPAVVRDVEAAPVAGARFKQLFGEDLDKLEAAFFAWLEQQ